MFKTVLFPIDGSREAREATDVVIDIVQQYNSRLVLLSVVESEDSEVESAAEPMASPAQVAQLLTNAQSLFSQADIQAETLEREGKPAFVICDVADEIGANLIIMGCRGLGLTDEGASESVTTRVVNLAPCPVMIVP